MKKNRMLESVGMSLLVLGAAACSASGPKYDEIAPSMPALSANEGRIFFYRDASIFGGAVTSAIRLNGEEVGQSKRGGFLFVDRPAGNYEVACSTEAEHRLSLVLDAGQERFVRTSVSMGMFVGRIRPELVNPSEGLSAVRGLAYIGPPLAAPVSAGKALPAAAPPQP
jgi:hypothetical protein